MPAWLRAIGAFCTKHEKLFAALSAIATALAFAVAAWQFYETRKALEASTVYQLQRDGRELFRTLIADSQPAFNYIYNSKKGDRPPPEVAWKVETAITAIIHYFSSVMNQRRNEVISDRYWPQFDDEMCRFIWHPPVTDFWVNRVQKGSYSDDFKTWGNECLARSTPPLMGDTNVQ